MLNQNAETIDEVIQKYNYLLKKRQVLYEEVINSKNSKHKKELKETNDKLLKIKENMLALLTNMQKQIDREL